MPKLMKVKEAAALLAVSPSQVYELVKQGRLKAYRLSAKEKGQGGIRFSQAQVDAFLAESETQVAEEDGDLTFL